MENTLNNEQKYNPWKEYMENELIIDEIIKEKEKFEKLLYKLELIDFYKFNRFRYIWQFFKTYIALWLIYVAVYLVYSLCMMIFWLTQSSNWIIALFFIVLIIWWILSNSWKTNRNEVMARNKWYEAEWHQLRAQWKTNMTKKQYKEYRKSIDWY